MNHREFKENIRVTRYYLSPDNKSVISEEVMNDKVLNTIHDTCKRVNPGAYKRLASRGKPSLAKLRSNASKFFADFK